MVGESSEHNFQTDINFHTPELFTEGCCVSLWETQRLSDF